MLANKRPLVLRMFRFATNVRSLPPLAEPEFPMAPRVSRHRAWSRGSGCCTGAAASLSLSTS